MAPKEEKEHHTNDLRREECVRSDRGGRHEPPDNAHERGCTHNRENANPTVTGPNRFEREPNAQSEQPRSQQQRIESERHRQETEHVCWILPSANTCSGSCRLPIVLICLIP